MKCVQESARLEALGLLASGVSHDFNNLLTGVLGCIQLAKEDLADRPGTLALLQTAEAAGVQARELCARIRDHVRRGTGQQEQFDLHVLVNDAIGLLGACRKQVTFDFRLKSDCAEVCGVPVEIRRILMNLLVNATEAMGDCGGHVILSSSRVQIVDNSRDVASGDYIELKVQDNGAGIPAAVVPRIFEPFFTTKETGTGLGLSAVKSVLQQHGGTISVESTLGVGTTFTLLLPLIGVANQAAATTPRGAGRVLVVDDDELLRPLIARVLRTEGFTVDEAADGPTALATYDAASAPYAAVMLDMTLPGGLDGGELLERLRARGMEAGAVLMSGLESPASIQRIDRELYSSFLRKPFSSHAILKAVKQSLTESATSVAA